jgi:hypothetical protein
MPFQYTFRSDDITTWDADTRDLLENRDRELELYSTTIDNSFLNLNASNLTSGTVPSARMTGAYTGITGLGALTSLDVQATTGTAVRITNTGTGNSFLVEDSASTDSTPFVIDAAGRVGIGMTNPARSLDVIGNIRATTTATQDGIELQGRVGGTSSYAVTLTPTTLTSSRTLTLPNVSGTAITTGNLSSITSVGTLGTLNIGGAGQNRWLTIDAPTGFYAIQYFAINGAFKWHYEVNPAGDRWSLVQTGVAERIGVTSTGATFSGTVTATTFSGSGASLTSLPAGQLTGTVASAQISGSYTGITGIGSLSTDMRTTASVIINNGSPTIYLQDTDHRSSMIHCNSNLFYVLRGSGNNSTTWAQVGGQWPLIINLENNNATVGNNLIVNNNGAAPSITLGNWSSSSAYATVESLNGYLIMGNTSDRSIYLRTNTNVPVYIGGNAQNTLQVGNNYLGVNGSTINDTLSVNNGSIWVQSMPAGSGPTVVNFFGFLRYVSSRRELKDNIVTVGLSDGLDRILALRPVEFTMKPEYLIDANEFTPFDVKRGFIADEVADVDHRYGQWGWVDENQMMATDPAVDGELPLEDATPVYWNHDAVIADIVASIQNINTRLQQLETV